MTLKNAPYEVEIRCHFDNTEDAYQVLPFLSSCLKSKYIWTITFYGLELFKSDQLLRTSKIVFENDIKYFFSWKGPDIGKFANIRQEFVEEITPTTTSSAIIRSLGGRDDIGSIKGIIQELERLGYHQFMSFEGTNLTGYYEPYDISVKLMHCTVLKWPLMLEIEQIANTEEEAIRCEQALLELCGRFQIHNRLVREEPPSLLYDALFD